MPYEVKGPLGARKIHVEERRAAVDVLAVNFFVNKNEVAVEILDKDSCSYIQPAFNLMAAEFFIFFEHLQKSVFGGGERAEDQIISCIFGADDWVVRYEVRQSLEFFLLEKLDWFGLEDCEALGAES